MVHGLQHMDGIVLGTRERINGMHYGTDKENELVLPIFFYLYMKHPFHVHLLHIYFEKLSPLTPSFLCWLVALCLH